MPDQEEQNPVRPKTPKSRGETPKKTPRRGQTYNDVEGAGAPQGGQRDGRQGDQEGIRR